MERNAQFAKWHAILIQNHYPPSYIQNIWKKLCQGPPPNDLLAPSDAQISAPSNTAERSVYVAIPYVPYLHHRLQAVMPNNVRLAPRAHDQLWQYFSTPKDAIPFGDQTNVIYSLSCTSQGAQPCRGIYIGRTSLTLDDRNTKHKSAFRLGDTRNSLFAHVMDQPCTHVIDYANIRILDRSHSKGELYFRESWSIHNSDNLFNIEKDVPSLPGPYHGFLASVSGPNVGAPCKPRTDGHDSPRVPICPTIWALAPRR